MDQPTTTPPTPNRGLGGFQVLGIGIILILTTILITTWWLGKSIYAAPFTPTQLTTSEQHILEAKLAQLSEEHQPSSNSPTTRPQGSVSDGPLDPEPYNEESAKREIQLSEKELNALIAKDPETAKHVAVDLTDDLVSLKLLVPMDHDVPVLGGKTLKLHVGVVLKYVDNRPVVAIRGMSLGGVPLPQSWWGDIKNINLVEKFGADGGFWDHFAKGVEHISIQEGQFRVKLKE
ncbi:arginine N-succinyltransferase [Nitrospira sp. M1]